jgi:DNA modification methylase
MRKEGKYDPKSYGGITGYADSFDEGRYQVDQIRVLNLMAKALKEDGVLVYNHKPRRKNGEMIHPMTWLSRVKGLVLMEEIIWDRGSTHNHSDRMMWPHTERLYVFRKLGGTYRLRNTDNLLFRSDIWKVPLTSRPADGHAAPFPLVLAENIVRTFSKVGDLVCDPYSGSGTSCVAAVTQGRSFVGSELDAQYHSRSIVRVENALSNKVTQLRIAL